MARIEVFTCDVCGIVRDETPSKGMRSMTAPEGWYSLNGRQMCGLPCVATFASDPDAYPAQELKPDPLMKAMSFAFKQDSAEPDSLI